MLAAVQLHGREVEVFVVPPPSISPMVLRNKLGGKPEFFLCHHGQDAKFLVGFLAYVLQEFGVPTFFDRLIPCATPSNTQFMQLACHDSTVGVVFFSPNFFSSKWTQRELYTFLHREQALRREQPEHNTDGLNSVAHPVFYGVHRSQVAAQGLSVLTRRSASASKKPNETSGRFILRVLEELLGLPRVSGSDAVQRAREDVQEDSRRRWPRIRQCVRAYIKKQTARGDVEINEIVSLQSVQYVLCSFSPHPLSLVRVSLSAPVVTHVHLPNTLACAVVT